MRVKGQGAGATCGELVEPKREAPVGMFGITTGSERVENIQATRHAERANQSGLLVK